MRRRSKGIETVVVTMATKREKHTRSMHRIFNKLTGRNNTVSQEQLKEDKELDAFGQMSCLFYSYLKLFAKSLK
jgi:hypothetical protein